MSSLGGVLVDLLRTYGGTIITLALGLLLYYLVGADLGLVVIGVAVGTLVDLNGGIHVVMPGDRGA